MGIIHYTILPRTVRFLSRYGLGVTLAFTVVIG